MNFKVGDLIVVNASASLYAVTFVSDYRLRFLCRKTNEVTEFNIPSYSYHSLINLIATKDIIHIRGSRLAHFIYSSMLEKETSK